MPIDKKAGFSFDRVDFANDKAIFQGAFKPHVHRHFLSFSHGVSRQKPRLVVLDFSSCTNAYPNTMLPLLATVQAWLADGINVQCILPEENVLRRLFLRTNWAHYLDPEHFRPSDLEHDRHWGCAILS